MWGRRPQHPKFWRDGVGEVLADGGVGRGNLAPAHPPTLLLLLPPPPLVSSPELLNPLSFPSSLLLHLPSLGVSVIYYVDRNTMLKTDLALFFAFVCVV